jgi:guanine nucleotide-binding protein G(I)/G(S)/G(T) subunit beta-1
MSSQAEIQEKISAARREADLLKDKIRQRKDQTADTSRKSLSLNQW